jgi:hypothetical protein
MAEPSAPISSLPPPYPAAVGIYPPPNVVHCNPVQGHPEMIKTTVQYQQQPAVQQVQMMTTCMFGDNPQNVITKMGQNSLIPTSFQAFCPTCSRQVITRVEKVNGTLVWLMVLLLMCVLHL